MDDGCENLSTTLTGIYADQKCSAHWTLYMLLYYCLAVLFVRLCDGARAGLRLSFGVSDRLGTTASPGMGNCRGSLGQYEPLLTSIILLGKLLTASQDVRSNSLYDEHPQYYERKKLIGCPHLCLLYRC